MMIIVAFDIGIKNFAFCRTHFLSKEQWRVLQIRNASLIGADSSRSTGNTTKKKKKENKKNKDTNNTASTTNESPVLSSEGCLYHQLYRYLDTFSWEGVDHILVEQQMSHRHASNIKALKLSMHVLAYFWLRHPTISTREYPSTRKTRVFHAPFFRQKKERKQWSVDFVHQLLFQGHEEAEYDPFLWYLYSSIAKKDDISDCVLMTLAFGIEHPQPT